MPDARSHRGAHPEDARDFADAACPSLAAAARELSFLFDSWILDRAQAWLDLPATIAHDEKLRLWLVDLSV